jgi:ABC-type glutathione transport system ATPase component
LEELNKELNRPMELPSLEKEQNSTEQELNNAQQNLSKSKNKSAGENQQNAAEQMQKMADQMDAAQNEANKEQQGEDMEMLRQILKNKVTIGIVGDGSSGKDSLCHSVFGSPSQFPVIVSPILTLTENSLFNL